MLFKPIRDEGWVWKGFSAKAVDEGIHSCMRAFLPAAPGFNLPRYFHGFHAGKIR